MTEIEKYYNKFNEDHRLTTRHGTVEFLTSLHFIQKYLDALAAEKKTAGGNCCVAGEPASASQNSAVQSENQSPLKILDIGAGTGRYSIELCHRGYDVTAVELVPRNLEVLRSKHENIKTWKGNATDLHFFEDETFDLTIMFGPLYHLQTQEEKLKAFREARRVTKKEGYIFAAYIMNEYAMIQYCFKEGKIKECLEKGEITEDFHCITTKNSLYSYQRLSDIDELNRLLGQTPVLRFAQDGASDYMRRELNSMDEETFDLFKKYHLATCTRPELLGASSHVVDVVKV